MHGRLGAPARAPVLPALVPSRGLARARARKKERSYPLLLPRTHTRPSAHAPPSIGAQMQTPARAHQGIRACMHASTTNRIPQARKRSYRPNHTYKHRISFPPSTPSLSLRLTQGESERDTRRRACTRTQKRTDTCYYCPSPPPPHYCFSEAKRKCDLLCGVSERESYMPCVPLTDTKEPKQVNKAFTSQFTSRASSSPSNLPF